MCRIFHARIKVQKRKEQVEREKAQKQMERDIDTRIEEIHGDWMNDILATRIQTQARSVLAKRSVSTWECTLHESQFEKERTFVVGANGCYTSIVVVIS